MECPAAMSFLLPVFGSDFPIEFAGLEGSTRESFLLGDIIRAAILVGRRRIDVARFGHDSWLEAQWRIYTIRAGLNLNPSWEPPTYLYRNAVMSRMDGSERGVLAYSFGNLVAKLLSERKLRAPMLLHHDVYRHHLGSTLGHAQVRPDFVAWSPWVETISSIASPWFTIESKGRTRRPTLKAKQAAKIQAASLSSVGGQATALHLVSVSYFSNNALHSLLYDPEPRETLKLDISLPTFARKYYEPIQYLMGHEKVSRPVNDGPFVVSVHGWDMKIVIHPWLVRWFRKDVDETSIAAFLRDERGYSEGYPFGPEGIAVIPGPSWHEKE